MDDADAKSALSWIRGFKRGVTNDPPDTCPDLPFDPNHLGDYSSGMRVGEAIREKTKIDHSSTLIIKGFPDGLVIQFAPQKDRSHCRLDPHPKLRHTGSDRHRIGPMGDPRRRQEDVHRL